ncbi:serine/threonine protein kinase [Streptomyces sp. NPDC007205]|uniref:NHL domain-containing protein n=1 Tax=Streptomyces sp. NPDC007205 TaxID=3154316 RepID=UPI0033C4E455
MSGAGPAAPPRSEKGEATGPLMVAGCGSAGAAGDGGAAVEAQLAFPSGVAVDAEGRVLIADHANHRIRMVDGSGVIRTVAGEGVRGCSGDGGPAVRAALGFPTSVAVTADGAMFIVDEMSRRVRRVGGDGVITTVAGDGARGGAGDGGSALEAELSSPCAAVAGQDGALFVGDAGTCSVRRIGPDGVISTVLSAAESAGTKERAVPAPFVPAGLAVDDAGCLYVADPAGRRLLRLERDGGVSLLAAPGPAKAPVSVDWQAPCAVAVDADGSLYVADHTAHRVWRLAAGRAEVLVSGGEQAQTGPAAGDGLAYPSGLAIDTGGRRLLVADNFHHRVVALSLPAVPQTRPGPSERDGIAERRPVPADLLVKQEVGVEVRAGQGQWFHIRVSSSQAWEPGRVTHRFTAPTGFVFDGQASCAYYRVDGGVLPGEDLAVDVADAGRTLRVIHEPRLNTPGHPAAALVYTVGARAVADAVPGRVTDGRAVIAGHPGTAMKATVLGDDDI